MLYRYLVLHVVDVSLRDSCYNASGQSKVMHEGFSMKTDHCCAQRIPTQMGRGGVFD